MRLCAMPLKGCFTMSARDNIGTNATAYLAQSHFHDTDVSLFQLLEQENRGESHGFIDAVYSIKKLAQLPAEYTQPCKIYRSPEELFAQLWRFNYEDLRKYPDVGLAKTEERSSCNSLLAQLIQLNQRHSIIYTSNVSSPSLSKILILCFHYLGIKSIHKRERNFFLCVQSLKNLLKWFFCVRTY